MTQRGEHAQKHFSNQYLGLFPLDIEALLVFQSYLIRLDAFYLLYTEMVYGKYIDTIEK